MKSQLRRLIATEALSGLAGLLFACAAFAGSPAGTVTRVDGPLFAQKANGHSRVIAEGATVDVGDTLVTGNETYAQIRFADDAEAILAPDTELTIDDAARWRLAKGGMQVTSGDIASHSTRDHIIATPFGTLAVDPSKFVVVVTPPAAAAVASVGRVYLAMNSTDTASDAQAALFVAQNTVPQTPGGRNPGLYVQVLDGAIHLTNGGGTQNFTAGQFGFTPGFQQPPVILPSNPGMQFTPPPSFTSTTGSAGGTGAAKPGDVDCIVR